MAVSFAGASQILAGSDYPHQIGGIPKMLESLQAMRISEDDRQDSGWQREEVAGNLGTSLPRNDGRRSEEILTTETRRHGKDGDRDHPQGSIHAEYSRQEFSAEKGASVRKRDMSVSFLCT